MILSEFDKGQKSTSPFNIKDFLRNVKDEEVITKNECRLVVPNFIEPIVFSLLVFGEY